MAVLQRKISAHLTLTLLGLELVGGVPGISEHSVGTHQMSVLNLGLPYGYLHACLSL